MTWRVQVYTFYRTQFFHFYLLINFLSHTWYGWFFLLKVRFVHLSRAETILFSATHLSNEFKSSCTSSRFSPTKIFKSSINKQALPNFSISGKSCLKIQDWPRVISPLVTGWLALNGILWSSASQKLPLRLSLKQTWVRIKLTVSTQLC